LQVALSILSAGRYGMGAATGGGMRKLVAMAAEYANSRIQFGSPIASYGLIQEKFARMTLDSYTVESMAYLTTGLIDTKGTGRSDLPAGQQMDMSIEAAICKVYGSEAMYSAVNDCIQVWHSTAGMRTLHASVQCLSFAACFHVTILRRCSEAWGSAQEARIHSSACCVILAFCSFLRGQMKSWCVPKLRELMPFLSCILFLAKCA
jgi:alkylation response protein AidB-like acyl-CoA dehydrogenase